MRWDGYRPGIHGWWSFWRLGDALRDGDGIQWKQIYRRGRPSARLRQSEQERKYYRNEARSRAPLPRQDQR